MDLNKELKGQIKDIYEDIRLSPEKKETAYEAIIKRAERENKETGKGKKEDSMKRLLKAAVVAGCILVGGGSVYAAVHLLHPSEVAKEMEQPKLADKFSGLSDHVVTQENDTYRVSYLGEVSGKNLTEQTKEDMDKEKTYYVLAVEKKGKEKITYDDSICATPFVKGFAPWQFNIFYMGGGAESRIINNVRYYIFEGDNIEIFADKGLYLGVCEDAPGSEEYSFDEKTGEISRNEDFKGLNMLFELDIDKSKADPEKAEKYIKEMQADSADDAEGESEDTASGEEKNALELDAFFGGLPDSQKKSFLQLYGTEMEKLKKTVKKGKDGFYTFQYSLEKGSFSSHGSGEADLYRVGELNYIGRDEAQTDPSAYFLITSVLNKDDTMTFSIWRIEKDNLDYMISPTKKATKEFIKFQKLYGDEVMEYIQKHGTVIPDSVETVKADKKGKFIYSYHKDENCFRETEVDKRLYAGGDSVGKEYYEGPAGETENGYVVITQKLNKDGTMTFQAYELDEKFVETVSAE